MDSKCYVCVDSNTPVSLLSDSQCLLICTYRKYETEMLSVLFSGSVLCFAHGYFAATGMMRAQEGSLRTEGPCQIPLVLQVHRS